MDMQSVEHLSRLQHLCSRIYTNINDIESIQKLHDLLQKCSPKFVKSFHTIVLRAFYPFMESARNQNGDLYTSLKFAEREHIVKLFTALFEKLKIENSILFFNFYAFLLFEIYNSTQHQILDVPEEYKLCVVKCMTSLADAVDDDLVPVLYVRKNASKLSTIMHVLLHYAENEALRSLRLAAIECIMSMTRVNTEDKFADIVLRKQVSDVFLVFLPGLATRLKNVALCDSKLGHKIPMMALRAWGRLVTLMMDDYGEKINLNDESAFHAAKTENSSASSKHVNGEQVLERIQNVTRNAEWYSYNDKQLKMLVCQLYVLAQHTHPKVRFELAKMAELLIRKCYRTMPLSLARLVDIAITLSEDNDENTRSLTTELVGLLTGQMEDSEFKALLESLEENFLNCMNTLPRKFINIDETEQTAALNLLNGYIRIFGKYNLSKVLLCNVHLNRLMQTLLHIVEIEYRSVSTLEDFSIKDFDSITLLPRSWKRFSHIQSDSIVLKIERICANLVEYDAAELVSDFLLECFLDGGQHQKEAIYLLNCLLLAFESCQCESRITVVTNILDTYIDPAHWYLTLQVGTDDMGEECTLKQVQSNVVHICLLVEGVGKAALALKKDFLSYLLRTLYAVLERAGSGHPLIRNAGLVALNDIAMASDFKSVTDFINAHMDYFSFHVERKLIKAGDKEAVLNVLTVVMKYSSKDVLPNMTLILEQLLLQSCDKHATTNQNTNGYLRVFQVFINCLRQWLNLESIATFDDENGDIDFKSIITKKERLKVQESEHYTVQQIDEVVQSNGFTDEAVMGTSCPTNGFHSSPSDEEEHLIETSALETENKPPAELRLVTSILNRSLHFLPSATDKERKLLVVSVLKEGLQLLKDWDNDLLPLVHQIWSPLVQRFSEFKEPLVINFSFQLLCIMGRLSKDFIRLRTCQDVLPNIWKTLKMLAKESYLKDRGAAYRFTQAFKLQLRLLSDIGLLLIDLDVVDKYYLESMDVIFSYLSDKQPLPLQKKAVQFYNTLHHYDSELTRETIARWQRIHFSDEYSKNLAFLR